MLICLPVIAGLLLLLVLAVLWLAFEVRMIRCGRVSPTLTQEVAKRLPEPESGWNNEAAFAGRTDY